MPGSMPAPPLVDPAVHRLYLWVMAGRPKLRALGATIEKMGEEKFWDMLLDVSSVAKVAEHLTKLGGQNFSRSLLHEWIAKDEDRKMRLRLIREAQAHSFAEDALEIVDGANAGTIAVDREKVRVRQWLAERWNRKDYGEEKAGPVINIQNLHLSALQAAGLGRRGAMEAEPERARLTGEVASYVSMAADESVVEGEDVEVVVDQEVASPGQG